MVVVGLDKMVVEGVSVFEAGESTSIRSLIFLSVMIRSEVESYKNTRFALLHLKNLALFKVENT
jgi:hypothetical protein